MERQRHRILMEQIMRAHGHKKTGLIGTINMKIVDETFEVKNTTPEALTLQKTFSKMVEQDVDSHNGSFVSCFRSWPCTRVRL